MCVNKILLKTAYKNSHLSILHTMSMGQHFWAILGAIDKRSKE